MKNVTVLLALTAMILFSCSSSDDSPAPMDPNNNDPQDPVVEQVAIPDQAFEQALIDLGIDNEIDGFVRKSAIENVQDLVLNDKGISDLTGIRDFDSLQNFWAEDNNISSVNLSGLSNLKFIFLTNNQLTSLNVAGFPELEKLSLDNNQLSSLIVGPNIELEILTFSGNNIDAIDVSTNFQLNRLDVRNNPLTCIKVSSQQLANIPEQWQKDDDDIYALNCN